MLVFTGVNLIGAKVVGRSETFIVVVKLLILFLFAGAGLFFIQPKYLAPELWPPATGILFGAGVLFIGYEGFGLVANAAEDMDNPRKLLPKALYLSVIIVILIYVAVSVAVVGNLDIHSILRAKDYALAEAAKPFLGDFGFRLIAVGALFSTASAINATLFGAANVSYVIARDGRTPPGVFMEISARRDRRAFHHRRACDPIHFVFRSLRHSDDGKRRFSLDLCMRACRPSESVPRDRRQQVDSESVLGSPAWPCWRSSRSISTKTPGSR